MRSERSEGLSHRPGFPVTSVRTKQEAQAELANPCGRFRLPYADEERMREKLVNKMERLNPLRDSEIILGTGIPLNWQRLIEFLQERKVITSGTFEQGPAANDLPYVHNFRLTFDRSSRPTDGRTTDQGGYGGSLEREHAMSKTVGETLERYFLSTYSKDSFMQATPAQMRLRGTRALDLNDLPGFSLFQRERFPQLGFADDTPIHWIQGTEYVSGKKTMLPAQSVFWNYAFDDERILIRPTTSGCAGHFSKDEAVLAGLLEHIQRDAFLIYWLNSLSPHVLNVDSYNDPELHNYLAYLQRYGVETTFLNTTSDIGIPTVTCVLVSRGDSGPIISIGSDTGFDAHQLLIHSAVEATLVHSYVYRSPEFKLPEVYEPFSQKSIGRQERLSLWRGEKMLERFSFFLSGRTQEIPEWMNSAVSVSGARAQLAYTLKCLLAKGKGYEPYIYEVRDPVLRELGYHVVRTIVPKLVPLYLFEDVAPLSASRLKEVPGKIGYSPAEILNPWPHPFP